MNEKLEKDSPTKIQKEKRKDFSFFYDVAKLVTGNGFVQFFRAILSPVISRLYLPEFFGITQNFSSIANILAVISALRYEQTIMLPKEKEKAANQFGISLLILSITTPLSLLMVLFFRHGIADLLNAPKLANYLWLIPLQVFAIGLFNIMRQWNARQKRFARLSVSQVINQVASDGMTAGLGFASLASSGSIIISRISGQLLASLTLGLLVMKEDGKFIFNSLRWEEMKAGMKEYKKFPLYNIWSSFLSTVALYMPGIILSAYFSPTEAGYFSYGQNALRLPIALVGNSIGQVFFQRGAKAVHEGKLRQTLEEAFKRLVVFATFPMLLLTIIGEPVFATVFGAEWAEAGIYSQILSIWTLSMFIATPFGSITNILGRNEISVAMNLLKVITGAISLIIGGILNDIYLGLWLFTITGFLTYGWYILWATQTAGIPYNRTLRYFAKNLLLCAPFLTVIYLFKQYNPFPDISFTSLNFSLQSISLIIFSIIISIIYFVIVILQDATIREALRRTLDKRKEKKS